MLVNLTPDLEYISEMYKRSEEIKKGLARGVIYYEYVPIETPDDVGIYLSSLNFPMQEFHETKSMTWEQQYDVFPDYSKVNYGVADNVEQVKEYYTTEISDIENKYFIHVSPIFQDKTNSGEGGGWRWHKWGQYIGRLNPQCEYLDDEDFGEDFEYVLVFHIYKIN